MKNYELLLSRVASWLKPGGKMFVHIFTHKSLPFHYTDGWMAENFFSGGQVRASAYALFGFSFSFSVWDYPLRHLQAALTS